MFKHVVEALDNEYDPDLQLAVQDYVIVQSRLQPVRNPAGSLEDGSGLGEAKFNVDLSPYLGKWGRLSKQ